MKGLYREHQLNGKLNLEIARFVHKDDRAAKLREFWDKKIDEETIRLFEPYRDQLFIKNMEAAIIVTHLSFHQVFQYLYQNKNNAESDAIFEEFLSMIKRYLVI